MKWTSSLGIVFLALLSCSDGAKSMLGQGAAPKAATSFVSQPESPPPTVDLSAVELLSALDSFTSLNSPKAWVDRFAFRDFRESESPLSEEGDLLTWANGVEVSLAFRGLVDLELDRALLQTEIARLIEARGARKDPDAVVISVSRMAASPKLLVAELSRSGDRYSGGYYVVWRKTPKGWVYHSSTMLWIACG